MTAPSPGRAGPPGPEGRPLAAERPGHGDREAARRPSDSCLTAPAASSGQRRVERAERDVGEQPELVGEPLPDLVAVQFLFLQQTQDGQFEHVSEPRGSERDPQVGPRLDCSSRAACSNDISIRYIDATNPVGASIPAGAREGWATPSRMGRSGEDEDAARALAWGP